MRRLRQAAAILMLITGVSHVLQPFLFGTSTHLLAAAFVGIMYFAIGVALFGQARAALWVGAILPTIGGVLGVIRCITVDANPFTFLHVGIDLLVVPICIYLIWCGKAGKNS
jgi:hypothetical protein